jgi:outer membrane immunogenic protein
MDWAEFQGYFMKELVVGCMAAAAFCGAPAFAADMPVKAAPAPVAPIYSWTGFYVGGNAGYGFSSDPTVTFAANDVNANAVTCGAGNCPPNASFGINGALGGVQAGYNWQVNQNWLLGVETDFDWSQIQGSGTSTFNFAGPQPSNFTASADVTSFGTVRARFGYLPTNSLLLFGTAGFAYGHVNEKVALNAPRPVPGSVGGGFGYVCASGPNCFVGSSSTTAVGWTAGAGFEYALWQNISVKAEYLYVALRGAPVDTIAVETFPGGFLPSSITAGYGTIGFSVVRGGLNYKFN